MRLRASRRKRERFLPQLDELEHRVEKVSVPLSYAEELYALRGHIDLVRKKLQGAVPNAEEFSA